MLYTARHAHLAVAPLLRVGQVIQRGTLIGVMGNTGKSTGPHLHFDCVEGMQSGHYRLADMEKESPRPSAKQCSLFIDEELFKGPFDITTFYYDPRYFAEFGKWHPGYDVVGKSKNIYWNRSKPGRVMRVFYDEIGYGHCVQIAFEA